MLASISSRASGSVDVTFLAAGRTTRFTVPIADGQVKVNRALPAPQASASSGTLTLTYAGDSDTQPYTVKLLATRRGASLKAKRPTIFKGRIKATGSISKLARGSVRVELRYQPTGATQQRIVAFKAPIAKGRYKLDKSLSATVLRDIAGSPAAPGSYVLFAGDKRSGIGGQSAFFALAAAR